MCHSDGLATAVDRTLVDAKVAGKHLYAPEFKSVTILSVFSCVIVKSFLGHRFKDEPSPKT